MHQISFSEQSLSELDRFDRGTQLELLSKIGELSAKAIDANSDASIFERDGKTYYRLKLDNLRIYVEKCNDSSLRCHYIIPQHTMSDFLFRSKFPISEEQMIERHSSFWKYLESLKK